MRNRVTINISKYVIGWRIKDVFEWRGKMSERKNETPEELQKDRLQAEISKIKAETNKLRREQEEIEKRVNQKWYSGALALKIVGLIMAIILIVASVISIIIPLAQLSIKTAELKITLAEAKLDSAVYAKAQAEKKETMLREQVQEITARLDSIKQRQKAERDSIANQLEKERSKSQLDRKRIRELESQLESKISQIENTESDKVQIEKIVTPPAILSGRVITQKAGRKSPLEGVLVMIQDGSIKANTDENGNFKLEIPASRGVFEKVIFSKAGYTEITLNLKPPNQNIEVVLEK